MNASTQSEDITSVPSLEFPVYALPQVVENYVEEQAQALGIPGDLVALPTITGLGAAIGNSRRILLKEGWSEPSQIYGAVVAPPGRIKTPAIEKPLEPILNRDDGQRHWTSDATVERLASLLQVNTRGILVYREELSGWVNSLNQYKNGKGADKQFYLSGWSGSSFAVDRQNGTDFKLARPSISVVGSIQPDLLSNLDDSGGKADGF